MTDVFISYSRRDKVFTQKLVDALQAANREVWADWASIPAASDWDAEIKEGIEKTNTVLFVLSPEWIKSNECRKEMVHALQHGKRLVPILRIMPDQGQEVPPELAKINWVYMRETDDFDKAFETLQSAMDTDLDWIKIHTRIQVRAIEWDKKNRDNSLTLRGNDLTEGEQFISQGAQKTPEPTQLQGEYILASRKDATRRQRITLAGVSIALVVSIALGIVAYFQRQAAVASEAKAVLNSKISFSRELTANSVNNLIEDPELSVLLALQAVDVLQNAEQPVSPETESALRLALQTSRVRYVVPANTRPDLSGAQTPDELYGLAFSPDGKLIATGSNTGKIKIWSFLHFPYPPYDQPTYAGTVWLEEAFTIPDAIENVDSIAFSPDGKRMATSASSKEFTPAVWDAETGKQLFELTGHKDIIRKIIFSPDGSLIATSSSDGEVIIWDAVSGEKKLSILEHTGALSNPLFENEVPALAFSPDGKYLVSGGLDTVLIASDTETGETVYTFDTELNYVYDVAFSPDGKYLSFAGIQSVLTFDFESQEKISTFEGHEFAVRSVSYNSEGTHILSAAEDGKIIISDAKKGIELFTLSGNYDAHISDAVFSPDEKYIASVNWGGELLIWDAAPVATTEAGIFSTSTQPITSLDYSPDGTQLAVANDGANTLIFTLPLSNNEFLDLPTRERLINDIVFSPDGKSLAASDHWGKEVIFYDVNSKKTVSTITMEDAPNKLAISPDGKLLGVGLYSFDESFVIDINSSEQQASLIPRDENPTKGTQSVDFSSDGKWFAVGYTQDRVQLLDLTDGETASEFRNHSGWVTSVKFSPDGKYLLSGSADGTAVLLDLAANEIVFSVDVRSPVEGVAFSPDGSKFATSTREGTIKVWDAADGTPLFTTPPAGTGIIKIKFSPDGKTLVAGGADGTLRFYYMQIEDLLTYARSRITRSLTEEECQIYLHEEQCPQTIAKPQERSKPENLLSIKPIVAQAQVVNEQPSLPYQNDFSSPTDLVETLNSEGASSFIENGVYSIVAKKDSIAEPVIYVDAADSELTIKAKLTSGPNDAGFGAVCRYSLTGSGYRYYLFMISNGYGTISLVKDGEHTILKDWTPASAINQGRAENIIKISCVGEQLKLIVNDEVVLETVDASLSSGQFALYLTSFSNSSAKVQFDDLLITEP